MMSSCFLTTRWSSQGIVLIEIHSMQDWTATRTLGVTKKEHKKTEPCKKSL